MNSASLLIYTTTDDAIPNLYLIPDEVAARYRNLLEQAHNKLINCDEMNDGMRFLMAALVGEGHEDQAEQFEENTPKEWRCVLSKYKVASEGAILVGQVVTSIYASGFVC